MYSNKNKENEQRDLDWLKSRHSIFDLNWIERESPDFAAIRNGCKVGLELTSYTGSQEETRKECLISKVKNICQAKLARCLNVPSRIEIQCDYERWPLSQNREEIAEVIVTLIRDTYKGESFELYKKNIPEILKICGIYRILVKRNYDEICPTQWSFPQLGCEKEISIDILQGIVDKKNRFREAYSEEFDETWLVILAQKFGGSSYYKPLRCPIKMAFNFDRVFLFESSTTCLLELELER